MYLFSQKEIINHKEKLCALGVMFSFNIILLSIAVINRHPWTIGDYGLVSILTRPYFAGLILFSLFYILLFKYSISRFYLIMSTSILVLILFGTPTLIEGTPRFGYVYRGAGVVDYILRTGHLSTNWSETGILSMYQNWPAIFLLTSSISLLSNVPIFEILLWTPVISQLFYFIPLYLFFSMFFNDKSNVFFACSLFYIANWLNQDFMACQNIGLFLSLLICVLFLRLIQTDKGSLEFKLLFIIVYFTLIVSHGLSSLAASLYIFIGSMAFMIKYKMTNILRNFGISMFFLMATLFLFWAIYGISSNTFETGIRGVLSTDFFNIISHFEKSVALGSVGGEVYTLISKVKIFDAIVFSLVCFIGLILYLKSIKFEIKQINNATLFCLSILVSNFFLYISSLYGDEAIIRAFLLSLLSLSYFSIQSINNKKYRAILILLFVISVPMHIFIHNSNERFEYYPPSSIHGMNFFYRYSAVNSTVIGFDLLDASEKYEQYSHSRISFIKDENNLYQFEKYYLYSSGNIYHPISENIRSLGLKFVSLSTVDDYEKKLSHLYNLVYDNGGSDLYLYGDNS